MSAERRIAAFFDLADRGLKSAEILFRDGQFEDAAYFAQQIVERLARALLTRQACRLEQATTSARWRVRSLSSTLAIFDGDHRALGTRNIGSFSTISWALSIMSFMRPRFPKVAQRPLTFDQ
jgi:hypothetical protein